MGFNSDSNNKSSQLTPFLKTIGNNCNRPACDDKKSALTAELEQVNVAKTKSGVKLRAEQPVRDEIGISMWNLVHSMMPSFVMGCIMCCFGKGVYV
jgi:hypothetical protein